MRLKKTFAAALFVLVFAPSAFATRDPDASSLFDRVAKIVARFVSRTITTNGDGLIPPLPQPKP